MNGCIPEDAAADTEIGWGITAATEDMSVAWVVVQSAASTVDTAETAVPQDKVVVATMVATREAIEGVMKLDGAPVSSNGGSWQCSAVQAEAVAAAVSAAMVARQSGEAVVKVPDVVVTALASVPVEPWQPA